jgi:hypothetical protein
MYKGIIAPYVLSGAIAGITWYGWYHLCWANNSVKSKFVDCTFGYALYGMAATAFFLHPKYYWAGFLGGWTFGKLFLYFQLGKILIKSYILKQNLDIFLMNYFIHHLLYIA